MDIRSVTGRRLLTAGMPDLGGGLDHAIAVRRTDLDQLLLEAVAGIASVDTRFGCAAMSADPSGAVTITSTTENSLDLGSTSLRADVIVAATESFGRAQHGRLSEPGVAREQLCSHDCEGEASPWFEEYRTPLGSFGQAPLDGDLIYFWAAAHVAGAADAVARRDLGPSTKSGDEYFPPQQTCWRGCRLSRICWSIPSAASLVGAGSPAAWFCSATQPMPCPPNLGQGANSALVDGVVLAWELARAPSVKDALVGYDKRPRPLARRVQKTAEMLQRLCGIEQVTALRVRDALLAGLARFPRLSDEAIR